jgi:small subunit ribosomal protein S1
MNEEIISTNQDLIDQELLDQDMQDVADLEMSDQALLEQQLEDYLAQEEYDYQLPRRGDIHKGIVIEIGSQGAIIDAGFKRDGIVQIEDMDRLDDETREGIQPGDEISVAVDDPRDGDGRLILSIYQALVQEDWLKAETMMKENELYEGEVSGYNRGGLLVPFGRIRGFIPASHVVGMPRGLRGEERRQRLEEMVGEEVGLKIIEVDRQRRRLIFSQRQARRAWQRVQRARVMEELKEGETCEGTVTGITDFGAFVDLGGADGLIHISELSWKQVDDPREVVEIGDEVEVYILNLDWKRKRIALSLKRLQPNPWSQVPERYQENQLVEGKVSRVLDFGAFVELDIGVEGLLHISEMTGTSQLSPEEIVEQGEKVLVKILSIDTHKERIALSARQVHRDEWERWMTENKIAPEAQEEEEAEVEAKAETEVEEAEEKAEEEAEVEAKAETEVEEVEEKAEEEAEAEAEIEEVEEETEAKGKVETEEAEEPASEEAAEAKAEAVTEPAEEETEAEAEEAEEAIEAEEEDTEEVEAEAEVEVEAEVDADADAEEEESEAEAEVEAEEEDNDDEDNTEEEEETEEAEAD